MMDAYNVSISNIAIEIRKLYQRDKDKFSRGQKGKFWKNLCRRYHSLYGEWLGYKGEEGFSLFVSDVKRIQLRIRKAELKAKAKVERGRNKENITNVVKRFYSPDEGSTGFTLWQIDMYGLNPDTY